MSALAIALASPDRGGRLGGLLGLLQGSRQRPLGRPIASDSNGALDFLKMATKLGAISSLQKPFQSLDLLDNVAVNRHLIFKCLLYVLNRPRDSACPLWFAPKVQRGGLGHH